MGVYADPEDLAPFLGGAADSVRAADAIAAASAFIDAYAGRTFGDATTAPPGVHVATVEVAVRYYRNPDAPYAVVGAVGEAAAYMSREIPDLDKLLLGFRVSWGIA